MCCVTKATAIKFIDGKCYTYKETKAIELV